MQLPQFLHEHLVSELQITAEKMRQEEDVFRKLYFFSAMFGEMARILNWAWDRDLVLIHQVTQSTYREIQARMELVTTSRERVVVIPGNLFDMLMEAVDELVGYVKGEEQHDSLSKILGRFSELGYVTTGNGNYLWQKGLIKLGPDETATELEQPSSQ